MHTDLTNLTEWVRGTISAGGCTGPGKFSIGKITPEKKSGPLIKRAGESIKKEFAGLVSLLNPEYITQDDKT